MADWQWAWVFVTVMALVYVGLFIWYLRLAREAHLHDEVNECLHLEVELVAKVESLPERPTRYKVRQARRIARTADVVTYAELAPVGVLEPIEALTEVTR